MVNVINCFFILTMLISTLSAFGMDSQNQVIQKVELNQKDTKPMSIIGSRRRRLPPEIDPIVIDGIVYKELRQANKLGYKQKSGYIIALDKESNEPIWHLKVYEINYIDGKETDVQEIFFTNMELLPGDQEILIENELEKQFIVNIIRKTAIEKK